MIVSKSVVNAGSFYVVVMLSLPKLRGWFLHVRQMIHHTTKLVVQSIYKSSRLLL